MKHRCFNRNETYPETFCFPDETTYFISEAGMFQNNKRKMGQIMQMTPIKGEPLLTQEEVDAVRERTRREFTRKQQILQIEKEEKARILAEGLHEAELRAKAREEALRAKQKEDDERVSDSNFVKVYPAGWQRLRELIPANKSAAIVYTFLAENIDETAGAVTVSQELLCDTLGLSRTTIWRAITYLCEIGAIVKIPVSGSVNAYALNADEVWKSIKVRKSYAAYTTKTLAKKDGTVNRKMRVMYKEQTGKNPPDDMNDLIED